MEKEDYDRMNKEMVENEYFEPVQTTPEQFNISDVFLDPSFIIDELINTLRGRIVDSINQQIIDLQPSVAEEAISFLVARILPYTSKLFALSNLDEEKIRDMVYDFEASLSGDLMYCEQFGIKRKDRDFIYNLTVHTMESTIRRAKDGITMKRMLSQHQSKEITTRQEMPEEKKLNRGRWKI